MGMHLRRRPLVEPLESRALLSGLQPVLPELLKASPQLGAPSSSETPPGLGTPVPQLPMTPPIVILPILPPHQHVITLAGTVTGTYTERHLPPEQPVPLPGAALGNGTSSSGGSGVAAPAPPLVNWRKIDDLTGTGTVTPLGAVTIKGDVFFPGPWPGPIPLPASAAAIPAPLPGGFLVLSTTPMATPTTTGTAASAGGSVFVGLQEVPNPTVSAGTPLVFRYFILGGTGAYREASGTGTADLTLTPSAATIPGPVTGNFTLVFNPTPPSTT